MQLSGQSVHFVHFFCLPLNNFVILKANCMKFCHFSYFSSFFLNLESCLSEVSRIGDMHFTDNFTVRGQNVPIDSHYNRIFFMSYYPDILSCFFKYFLINLNIHLQNIGKTCFRSDHPPKPQDITRPKSNVNFSKGLDFFPHKMHVKNKAENHKKVLVY